MKILGNRVLVSRVEEEKKEGFQTVDVQNSFVYKGKIEQLGKQLEDKATLLKEEDSKISLLIEVGDIIYFAKYSPDIMEITHEGKEMKIVPVSDILAIL